MNDKIYIWMHCDFQGKVYQISAAIDAVAKITLERTEFEPTELQRV